MRHRAKLVAVRSGLKAGVHAVLAKQGVLIPVSDLFGVDSSSCWRSPAWTVHTGRESMRGYG